MRFLYANIIMFAVAAVPACVQSPAVGTAYTNGVWYDGDAFVGRDVLVRDGLFAALGSGEPADVVDLDGAFVLPAFGEAHHHMVLCRADRIKQFLDAGIVYAGIMNHRVSSRACQAEMNTRESVEVINALAGVTAPDAHPTQIGARFLDPDNIDGEWVHHVADAEHLDTLWPRIDADRPDILKVFLSYSEEYEMLRDDENIPSWYRGLDPDLIPAIVEGAHERGLRVAAHVMSANDFDVSVNAGVDIVAHLPGFVRGPGFTDPPHHPWLVAAGHDDARYLISATSAQAAADRGALVITTVSDGGAGDVEQRNIATLRDAGVTLLIGSDRGEYNSVDEAVFLVESEFMPADEVVQSLSMTTPRALFPDRDIASFTPGAEATFVVLGGDPLADISALRDVRMLVKNGRVIRPVTSVDSSEDLP
jgi:imidazolonepropionase-like amidohydrolase